MHDNLTSVEIGAAQMKVFVNLGLLQNLAVFSLIGRDVFSAPLRYYLDIFGAGFVYYIPDAIGISVAVCLLSFYFLKYPFRIAGLILCLLSAAFIGFELTGSSAPVIIALKMVFPLILGGLLYNCEFMAEKYTKTHFILIIPLTFSVLYQIYGDFSWTGYTYMSAGGLERSAGRSWTLDGLSRLSGIAADSHSAAFLCMILVAIIGRNKAPLIVLPLLGLAVYSAYITTSRTGLLSILLFVILYIIYLIRFYIKKIQIYVNILYFILIMSPIITVILAISMLYGESVTRLPASLESYWMRANITWIDPFVFIGRQFPEGFFLGIGLGTTGVAALMTPFSGQYILGLDNFMLGIFCVFGIPGIAVFCYYAIFSKRYVYDNLFLSVLMFYGSTIQGFGLSTYCILVGSLLFSNRTIYGVPFGELLLRPKISM